MANLTSDPSRSPLGGNDKGLFDSQLNKRYRIDSVFSAAAWTAVVVLVLVLAVLIGDVLVDGVGRLSWDFLTSDRKSVV